MNFSVIIPTYNRQISLQHAIESVLKLVYDDYEVIVVDDGSTDSTHEYLSGFSHDSKIRTITELHRGPAAARNAGLRIAGGRWIAYTDDDCRVPPDWLRKFEDEFNNSSPDIIGGAARDCSGKIFSALSQEMNSHYIRYLRNHGRREFLTSNNVAYTAAAIRASGGFNEHFTHPGGEERELNRVIISRGGTCAFLPGNLVDHYHDMSARDFFRQQQNYGRGSFMLVYSHRGDDTGPPLLPPGAYVSLLSSWVKGEGVAGLRKCALFFLAQLAVAIGFVRHACSQEDE